MSQVMEAGVHAITELADSQASDRTVMSIAGHVSQQMLAHYSHVRIGAKRKALDALSVGVKRCNLLEINGTDSPSLIHQGNSKELFGWLIGPRSDTDCRICTKVNDSAILRRNRDAFSCLGIEAASQSRKDLRARQG